MSQAAPVSALWSSVFSGVFLLIAVILASNLLSLPDLSMWELSPQRLQAIGWPLGVLALNVFLLGQLWRRRSAVQQQLVPLPTIIGMLVLWGAIIVGYRSEIIEGQRYWWLADDMMISMRYARNLVEGYGLVWNPGEYVEGYTNPLWTLLMAGMHFLGLPNRLNAVPMLLASLGSAGLLAWHLYKLVLRLEGGIVAQAGALLWLICSAAMMTTTVAGFEQILLAALLVTVLCRLAAEIEQTLVSPATLLMLGLIPLVRTDAAILSLMVGVLALVFHPSRTKLFLGLCLAAVPALIFALWRYNYYGDWLPNTYYLKVVNWPGRSTAGMYYVLTFAKDYALLLLLAAFGVWRSRHVRGPLLTLVLVPLIGFMAYCAYIGGDALGIYRILSPVIPLLYALAALAMPTFGPVGILMVLVVTSVVWAPFAAINTLKGYFQQDVGNTGIALEFVRQAPTAYVADGFAGTLFYFAPSVHGVDVLGKMDPVIARGAAWPGANVPGHNKFDFSWSLGQRKPEYVVANFRDPPAYLDALKYGDWAVTWHYWHNLYFQQYCLQHPMPWQTWRTVYHCAW